MMALHFHCVLKALIHCLTAAAQYVSHLLESILIMKGGNK